MFGAVELRHIFVPLHTRHGASRALSPLLSAFLSALCAAFVCYGQAYRTRALASRQLGLHVRTYYRYAVRHVITNERLGDHVHLSSAFFLHAARRNTRHCSLSCSLHTGNVCTNHEHKQLAYVTINHNPTHTRSRSPKQLSIRMR